MNNEYLQKLAFSHQEEISHAQKEGKTYEYIGERALDIERDSGGKIMKIYFTLGGPTVWLDFYCHPGYVITASSGCENGVSGLPYDVWEAIKAEAEEW